MKNLIYTLLFAMSIKASFHELSNLDKSAFIVTYASLKQDIRVREIIVNTKRISTDLLKIISSYTEHFHLEDTKMYQMSEIDETVEKKVAFFKSLNPKYEMNKIVTECLFPKLSKYNIKAEDLLEFNFTDDHSFNVFFSLDYSNQFGIGNLLSKRLNISITFGNLFLNGGFFIKEQLNNLHIISSSQRLYLNHWEIGDYATMQSIIRDKVLFNNIPVHKLSIYLNLNNSTYTILEVIKKTKECKLIKLIVDKNFQAKELPVGFLEEVERISGLVKNMDNAYNDPEVKKAYIAFETPS